MPDDNKNQREIDVFASSKELVNVAKTLLETNAHYAGIASFLCYQSAKQMMVAFIDLRELEIIDETGWTSDYWDTCTNEHPELNEVDDEVQLLLDCEMDSYPDGDAQESRNPEHAMKMMYCTEKLEQALLEAEPRLAQHGPEQQHKQTFY
jgi:hypothetical protein